jgi:hypothetical protein
LAVTSFFVSATILLPVVLKTYFLSLQTASILPRFEARKIRDWGSKSAIDPINPVVYIQARNRQFKTALVGFDWSSISLLEEEMKFIKKYYSKFLFCLFVVVFLYITLPYVCIARIYYAIKKPDTKTLGKLIDSKELQINFMPDVELIIKKLLLNSNFNIKFETSNIPEIVSNQISSPEGLILLYTDTSKFISNLKNSFFFGKFVDITKNKKTSSQENKKSKEKIKIEGPNIKDLPKKIKYAFFDGLFSFKLIIIRENLKFEFYLKLKEFTWKLVKIKLPVDELSNPTGV